MPPAIPSFGSRLESLEQAREMIRLERDVGVELDEHVGMASSRRGRVEGANDRLPRLSASRPEASPDANPWMLGEPARASSTVPSVDPLSTMSQATGADRLRGDHVSEALEVGLPRRAPA